MPETPPDKLQGWLEREEEEFTVTGAVYKTIDPEACRKMLLEELGYDPTPDQVALMFEAGRLRYAGYPQIGVRAEMVTFKYGQQLWYRDILTGRRLGFEDVQSRLAEIGFY